MANPSYVAERFQELSAQVLAPLVLGGPIRPVRPFGVELGMQVGGARTVLDQDLRSQMDVARVRVARLIAPVDTLPELSTYDWALAAALNDLLQLTNHELGGALTRGRYRTLLGSVIALCERIPPPRTVESALSRQATFARVLECVRTDTTVSWWTGRASFRGQPAPKRLLAWPKARNVNVDARRVALTEMLDGVTGVTVDEYLFAVSLWLTRTPLTDLATLGRRRPTFGWSASTLSVIATGPGRSLAYRLLARAGKAQTLDALRRARKEIPARHAEARALCAAFEQEVRAGFAAHGEETDAEAAARGEGTGAEAMGRGSEPGDAEGSDEAAVCEEDVRREPAGRGEEGRGEEGRGEGARGEDARAGQEALGRG
ncbi:hypothetical protein [Chondromyces crocatus]|uniref:Uncharacterized protein n=1 Tax=Chondromyces crocatus TaxID=52 RepID=A0A0K1ELY1_CHOCO|nr:hypothetical protein [Chondromyces crocatus]AKT41608.1 uncharacterized protein CMC5_058150 [Chondromyces crocatus]